MQRRTALVLGLGNRLMSDDAAGPLVIERLQQHSFDNIRFCDGGTAGLNLLPDIEACDVFIAVDAARFGATPGTVRAFEGEAMDRQLMGRKSTAHEVALADLIAAAKLTGTCPELRALVAVEPERISLGLDPTAPVAKAIPEMAAIVMDILNRMFSEAAVS